MSRTVTILTIPNLLTAGRLLALPFVVLLFRCGHGVAAAVLFAAAMLTDCLDGWIAKRLDQRTALGLYLDPVVDKIVILVLFYELAHAHLIGIVAAHLFLARELLQNAVRVTASAAGEVVGANWMGKVKAFLQTVVITAALAAPQIAHASRPGAHGTLFDSIRAAVWAILALTWCFFGLFVFRNRHVFSGGEKH